MITRRSSLLFLLLAPAAIACQKSDGAGGAPKRPVIAVIPKGTTHEFWKSVHAGAAKAGKELGVDILWKGPLKEDDLKSQIDIVENMKAQGVAGIVLAPLNDKALVNAVKGAVDAKIPVVIFDSNLQGHDYAAFVATDNVAAGKLAGEHLAKLLGGVGKVVMLRYQEGSASTSKREEGFAAAIREHKDLAFVSDNRYAGATTETAFAAAENILSAQKAAEGGVNGVFCPNESTTFGMLLALQKAGLAGKIKLVGFDGSEKLVEGLRAGQIDGLVLQAPMKMGEMAVRTLVSHLHGEKVSDLDTGAKLVTKDNMNDPEIKELLHPDLAKWLGE